MNDKPSPPWFGGLILGCLTLATGWILTYTLAPLPGQSALGGWNYVVVGVLLTFFIGLSMEWHGDPSEKEKREAAQRSSDGSAAGSLG
ncbi:hypothetical protein GCM10009839_59590 [Catenulispora yoronensis]|uniref:Cell division protein CrgA n=1 Tax=Catenulispora yoronensis TaxID=450799 RepID=A0ABP5GLI4_9ACTN